MSNHGLVEELARFFEQRPLILRTNLHTADQWPGPNYRGRASHSRNRPLLAEGALPSNASLNLLIERAEKLDRKFSFGSDIDSIHDKLFGSAIAREEKHELLREWLSRHQPCLLGRLASKGLKGFNFDVCWLDDADIAAGDSVLSAKIQLARRQWKDRAANGLSHGFLIMLNSERLVRCKPSDNLLEICQRIAGLYLIEAAPIDLDTIYTEAMPLHINNEWCLFKAGVNVFYSAAHRTLNHDRRVPGGILISVNSPGHLANSLVKRNLSPDLESAIKIILDLAIRSIGNGGIGNEREFSTSWHNGHRPGERCPFDPNQLGADFRRYAAAYHTDVLVPASVTRNGELDSTENLEVWSRLILDYISSERFQSGHVNYGLFHGHPISEEAKYFNPWTPRRAFNEELLA